MRKEKRIERWLTTWEFISCERLWKEGNYKDLKSVCWALVSKELLRKYNCAEDKTQEITWTGRLQTNSRFIETTLMKQTKYARNESHDDVTSCITLETYLPKRKSRSFPEKRRNVSLIRPVSSNSRCLQDFSCFLAFGSPMTLVLLKTGLNPVLQYCHNELVSASHSRLLMN